MKRFLKKIACPVLLLLMVMVQETESRGPVLHRVGGGRTAWKPNVNFTDWAIHEQFFVGDWLYFGFNKQLYSVLQVNQTSYTNCIEEDFIKNITQGGRDVFNLTKAESYYFISGRGYCFKGMKVAIIVQQDSSPFALKNGSLLNTISSASNLHGKSINMVVLLASITAWIFLQLL